MATSEVNEDGRAARKQMISESWSDVEKTFDKSIVKQDSSITQGLLWNQNKHMKDLAVFDRHDWSGVVTTPYPTPLHVSKYGQPAIFVHCGPLPNGSKGAVVYADGIDSTARKWLVAFDCVNNQVYVEAGAIGPTNWDVVEERLRLSGSESSSEDPAYHGKAFAEIRPVEQRSLVFVWFSD